jgi:hypothetical protein
MARRTEPPRDLALALARGLSRPEAAKVAHLSERTVRRRMGDPSFRKEVERLRGELVAEAAGRLADAAAEAVDALRDVMKGESPWARLGAAQAILANVVRVREHAELEARVAELERRAGELGGRR